MPKCKLFGAPTRNSPVQPIKCNQPFALVAGDYLSLPVGKGGFKTVGLYIDSYSGFLWPTKLKSAGTGKTTVNSLKRIFHNYAIPNMVMTDGGSHFNNAEVDTYCKENDVKHITTAAYSPWVNGLIENANKLLLGRLKRLCAPNHDEITDKISADPQSIPQNWPDHFDKAICQLNDHILPALYATPCKLLFGQLMSPEKQTSIPTIPFPTTPDDVHTNFTLAEMFCANAHLLSLQDAKRWKQSFDTNSPIVTFKTGDLVQVYDSTSDFNHRSINKLTPKWSQPLIISGKFSNSYSLCTLNGIPLKSITHSRRMRHYIPLCDTALDTLHPRDPPIPTTADLGIAKVKERMIDEFMPIRAMSGDTL
jgi:hypothetical protein